MAHFYTTAKPAAWNFR